MKTFKKSCDWENFIQLVYVFLVSHNFHALICWSNQQINYGIMHALLVFASFAVSKCSSEVVLSLSIFHFSLAKILIFSFLHLIIIASSILYYCYQKHFVRCSFCKAGLEFFDQISSQVEGKLL